MVADGGCPTWPTLRRFWKQGDSPVPPAGAAPPALRSGQGWEGAYGGVRGYPT